MSRESKQFVNALTEKNVRALGLDNLTRRMTGAQRRNTDAIAQKLMQHTVTYGTPIERGTK
jgi:hypothetical protein